jgi:predicted amidohydrolase YtcJ
VRAAVEHHESGQRLDVTTALAAHTEGGHAAAREDGGGVLRVGGRATFAVWEGAEPGDDGLPEVRSGAALPTCRLTVRDGVVLTPA